MGFVESLRAERSGPTVVLFEFLNNYKSAQPSLHVFFEGQDDQSFYMGILAGEIPAGHSLIPYRCGSKRKVYEIFNKIDWATFAKNRALFFVDKDLSEFLGETWPESPNIFVTEYYSIENYIVSGEMLKRFLREILHLNWPEKDIAALEIRFMTERKKFVKFISLVMAWIIRLRLAGARPLISNIELGKLCELSDDLEFRRITAVGGLCAQLEDACGVALAYDCFPLVKEQRSKLLELNEPKSYIRGKFELWFFVEFSKKIPALCNNIRVADESRVIVYTLVSLSNAVEVLGPRLRAPAKLSDFLHANWKAVNRPA